MYSRRFGRENRPGARWWPNRRAGGVGVEQPDQDVARQEAGSVISPSSKVTRDYTSVPVPSGGFSYRVELDVTRMRRRVSGVCRAFVTVGDGMSESPAQSIFFFSPFFPIARSAVLYRSVTFPADQRSKGLYWVELHRHERDRSLSCTASISASQEEDSDQDTEQDDVEKSTSHARLLEGEREIKRSQAKSRQRRGKKVVGV
nr:hypothetical protein CFP56_57021 [Quercus suber]